MYNELMFTKNDHFKFGYDNQWFVDRTNPSQRFTVEFGKCDQVADWRTESISAAKQIAANTDLPIKVLYSGGIDSEVTVMSFLAAGVPITAEIMAFEHYLNQHDIQYAIDFCKQHDVPYKFHYLDILRFFDGQMYDYAAATHCTSPQLCATMWLVDQVQGYPVIGQGECVLILKDDTWYFRESEMVNSFYRHFMVTEREGIPGFHQYTPEQMLSFLLDPTFLPFMNTASGKTSNKTTKPKIYQNYFPHKERPKFTGFEYIMNHDAKHREKLMSLYSDWTDHALIEYTEFIDNLNLNKYKSTIT